ncbi:hypothetical protein ACFLUT_03435 [Chloroflexota bacterium]
MKIPKRRLTIALIAAMAIAVLVPMTALAEEAETIDIVVAPSTINLNYQGPCVTVHTDLAFSESGGYVWYLDGVEAYDTFADDCGDLVAKFDSDAVMAVLEASDEPVTLTLTGQDGDVVIYQGTDDVRVISRGR